MYIKKCGHQSLENIYFVGKLSRLPDQPRKPQKFSPSNDLPCTVLYKCCYPRRCQLAIICLARNHCLAVVVNK